MPELDRSDTKLKRRSGVYSVLLLALFGATVAGKFYVDRIVAEMRNADPSTYIAAAIQMQWLLGAGVVFVSLIALVAVRYGLRVLRAKETPYPEERLFATPAVISGPRATLQGILYIVAGIFCFAVATLGAGSIYILETIKKIHL